MNASLATFLTAIGSVAASVVLALTLAEPAAAPQPVVQLERVVVVAPRAPVEQLPRVVVERRRSIDGLALAESPDKALVE